MISRLVALIRALSGGQVEDRAVVRLAKTLRAEGPVPAALVEALTRAIERVGLERAAARVGHTRRALALSAIFGAVGGGLALRSIWMLLDTPRPWIAFLPFFGALLGLGALLFGVWPERNRAGREAATVAFELTRAGVGTIVALDVALYAAGRASSALRRCLEAAPIAEGAVPDRARAAIAIVAADAIRGPFAPELSRKRRANLLAIAAAAWVVITFWALYFLGLSSGLWGSVV